MTEVAVFETERPIARPRRGDGHPLSLASAVVVTVAVSVAVSACHSAAPGQTGAPRAAPDGEPASGELTRAGQAARAHPPSDSDSDGVANDLDLCSGDLEDLDGFEDSDGCADPDNDRDRILDICDYCPDDSEVFNGNEDHDGCPDRGRIVITHSGNHYYTDKVYFRRRSARIMAHSRPILDALAATLREHPQIERVACIGHTDRTEPDAAALSQARADAVRDELIARGVEASRLESHGAGNRQPLTPGRTADQRARDRRVDSMILRINGVERLRWNGEELEWLPEPPTVAPMPPPPPRPVEPPAEPHCPDAPSAPVPAS